ncbi:hypothetical protein ACMD2_08811 [Ananas comosus]|uniref:Uncharacterized protein n=1 Tax=Ananas comosus TaxID=4615 RepID=A0A199UIG1_ANACO|nr:hypothetical protein ACMD2_08811 [Ananas comosus]
MPIIHGEEGEIGSDAARRGTSDAVFNAFAHAALLKRHEPAEALLASRRAPWLGSFPSSSITPLLLCYVLLALVSGEFNTITLLLQNDINLEVEDAAVTSRVHLPNQHSQISIQSTNPSDQTPSGLFG